MCGSDRFALMSVSFYSCVEERDSSVPLPP